MKTKMNEGAKPGPSWTRLSVISTPNRANNDRQINGPRLRRGNQSYHLTLRAGPVNQHRKSAPPLSTPPSWARKKRPPLLPNRFCAGGGKKGRGKKKKEQRDFSIAVANNTCSVDRSGLSGRTATTCCSAGHFSWISTAGLFLRWSVFRFQPLFVLLSSHAPPSHIVHPTHLHPHDNNKPPPSQKSYP
ncbi:uncharacterized protein LY79DRAFT_360127 [Colletotrichum navitas]|uniref:Uncharacterized protein n=1 Tax=Colletotrichum navitas TaxID=681940 RepID=A0AAD8PS25_9PEZI|nr:uncharacterized protein LY79DRAFT_360127 [Colletotrichum navitas]KAK1574761.1 hypothetical protein LY79DRAFT_360127 [Colletotrichum navitas]